MACRFDPLRFIQLFEFVMYCYVARIVGHCESETERFNKRAGYDERAQASKIDGIPKKLKVEASLVLITS